MPESGAFVFLASLQERSGVSFDQDEATIRLKVPKSEKPNMVGMVALTDCVLRVTVEVVPAAETLTDFDESDDQTRQPAQAKRRPARSTLRVVGG